MLQLKSSADDGLVEIAWRERDWLDITLSLPRLQASAKADAGFQGPGLGAFFRSLAHEWRGWEGTREWASVDGLFDLRAAHDGLGHIALKVRLRSGQFDDDWRCEGVIELDAGQLDWLAKQAESFDAQAIEPNESA